MHLFKYSKHKNSPVLSLRSSAKHNFTSVNTAIKVELLTDSRNDTEIKKFGSRKASKVSKRDVSCLILLEKGRVYFSGED